MARAGSSGCCPPSVFQFFLVLAAAAENCGMFDIFFCFPSSTLSTPVALCFFGVPSWAYPPCWMAFAIFFFKGLLTDKRSRFSLAIEIPYAVGPAY